MIKLDATREILPISWRSSSPTSVRIHRSTSARTFLDSTISASNAHSKFELADLRVKCEHHRNQHAAVMITCACTHGVSEMQALELCEVVHVQSGGWQDRLLEDQQLSTRTCAAQVSCVKSGTCAAGRAGRLRTGFSYRQSPPCSLASMHAIKNEFSDAMDTSCQAMPDEAAANLTSRWSHAKAGTEPADMAFDMHAFDAVMRTDRSAAAHRPQATDLAMCGRQLLCP